MPYKLLYQEKMVAWFILTIEQNIAHDDMYLCHVPRTLQIARYVLSVFIIFQKYILHEDLIQSE